MAAGIQVAAADRFKPAGLRRPSFSLSPAADTFSLVFRTRAGSQSSGRNFRQPGDLQRLSDDVPLPGKSSAVVAGRAADLRQSVLLPDEHGQGAAPDDHLHGARNLSAVPAQIYLAA